MGRKRFRARLQTSSPALPPIMQPQPKVILRKSVSQGKDSDSSSSSGSDSEISSTPPLTGDASMHLPPKNSKQIRKLKNALAKVNIEAFDEPTQKRGFKDFKRQIITMLGKHDLKAKVESNLLSNEESEALYWGLAGAVAGQTALAFDEAKEGDFLKAWKLVQERWNPTRLVNRHGVLKSLVKGSPCAELDNLQQWMSKNEELKKRLESFPKDKQITADDLLVLTTLEGVPSELKGVVEVAETRAELTYADLKVLLLDKRDKILGEESVADKARNYNTSTAPKEPKVRCQWCGLPGHYAVDCRKRLAAEASTKGAKGGGKNGAPTGARKCYLCGDTNHLANKCPKNRGGKKGSKATAHHTVGDGA